MHFSSRNVFITVDGKKAKLFIQESNKLTFKPSICDCNVIVYAVNDRKSFGVVNICILNWFTYPWSLDIAVSLLSRLFKSSQELGREKRVILVGNKTDLARNREVSPKVLLTQSSDRSLVILVHSYLLSVIARRAETQPFFTGQNLLKLELESGIILINFWWVSSFNQGIRNNFKLNLICFP